MDEWTCLTIMVLEKSKNLHALSYYQIKPHGTLLYIECCWKHGQSYRGTVTLDGC